MSASGVGFNQCWRDVMRAPIVIAAVATAAAISAVSPAAIAESSSDSTSFSVVAGPLNFSAAPALPRLPTVTLNGQAQTTSTTMTEFAVADTTGGGSGWNVTVNGDASSGKSPVFESYCPNPSCGSDTGPGYVSGGPTLPASSLILNSGGASFIGQNGSTGNAPSLECASDCDVDSATPYKIASAAADAGMGTWATTGWSATSLALSVPSTLPTLPPNEVYRVDLIWSLGSGP
jgi:WxL domain surface cell wall-binding